MGTTSNSDRRGAWPSGTKLGTMERVREGMREEEDEDEEDEEASLESEESELPVLAFEANSRAVCEAGGGGDESDNAVRDALSAETEGSKRVVVLTARARNSVAVEVNIRRCSIVGEVNDAWKGERRDAYRLLLMLALQYMDDEEWRVEVRIRRRALCPLALQVSCEAERSTERRRWSVACRRRRVVKWEWQQSVRAQLNEALQARSGSCSSAP